MHRVFFVSLSKLSGQKEEKDEINEYESNHHHLLLLCIQQLYTISCTTISNGSKTTITHNKQQCNNHSNNNHIILSLSVQVQKQRKHRRKLTILTMNGCTHYQLESIINFDQRQYGCCLKKEPILARYYQLVDELDYDVLQTYIDELEAEDIKLYKCTNSCKSNQQLYLQPLQQRTIMQFSLLYLLFITALIARIMLQGLNYKSSHT